MRRRFAWENKGGLVGANGEEDIGDGEELVGAGEERVCLHRPLRGRAATDRPRRHGRRCRRFHNLLPRPRAWGTRSRRRVQTAHRAGALPPPRSARIGAPTRRRRRPSRRLRRRRRRRGREGRVHLLHKGAKGARTRAGTHLIDLALSVMGKTSSRRQPRGRRAHATTHVTHARAAARPASHTLGEWASRMS